MAMSLADVKTIYQRLLPILEEQAEIEIAAVAKLPNQTEEEFESYKTRARNEAFKITFTLGGRGGVQLFGDESIFESPQKPDKIESIYFTNITAYRSFCGTAPLNQFELNLDFSKPALLDSRNGVSAPTPNLSNLTVQGNRTAWMGGISDAVINMCKDRRTRRGWIHRGFVYDAGLMLLALPFALYVCWKASPLVSRYLEPVHGVISGGMYVYLFFVVIWAYRALFGYTKWAFPTAELTDNKDGSLTHRAIWGAIVLGLVGNVLWEIGRSLFA